MEGVNDLGGDLPEDVVPIPTVALTESEVHAFWQRCLELRPKLASYLRTILPDHHAVDDCLQEAFLLMMQRYSTVEGEDLSALAFTCARFKAQTWLSKNRVGKLSILDPAILSKIAEAAARGEEEEPIGYPERIAALRECMDRLSPEQRSLIDARYGSERGKTIMALADQKDLKADALYKQLERLRAVLKRCISGKLPALEL